MNKLQVGDAVRIDGKTVTIAGYWGQGKHMAYRLSDDRVVLDLHLAVESGEVEKVTVEKNRAVKFNFGRDKENDPEETDQQTDTDR